MIETKEQDGAAPLDDLLAGQEELLDELDALAGRQSELVAQARTEALLELLARRQVVIDRFLDRQRELGALAATGAVILERPGARERLERLGARLGEIIRRDDDDGARLRAGRPAMPAAEALRRARSAYGAALGGAGRSPRRGSS
jgi:hypothetical protein